MSSTKTVVKSALITGANAGLGKETARQLALLGATKIYLGCRNRQRAEAAQRDLEEATGKHIFEIVQIDVTDLASVRAAAAALPQPVEAVVLNAGGMGGTTPGAKTPDGVTTLFGVNVLGHVVLVDELAKANKITKTVVYTGSEAARGVPKMMMKRPALKTSSEDELASIADGSFFGEKLDPMVAYGPVKYLAALWMSAMARRHPDLRFVTMSPGGTGGTNAMESATGVQGFLMRRVVMPMMTFVGFMHSLPTGAKRLVDALTDERFESGVFYASEWSGITGPVVDQATIFPDIGDETIQDNAYAAIHHFTDGAAQRQLAG